MRVGILHYNHREGLRELEAERVEIEKEIRSHMDQVSEFLDPESVDPSNPLGKFILPEGIMKHYIFRALNYGLEDGIIQNRMELQTLNDGTVQAIIKVETNHSNSKPGITVEDLLISKAHYIGNIEEFDMDFMNSEMPVVFDIE